MNYKNFIRKLCVTDAVLDSYDKDKVTVSANKVEDVPVLFFKVDGKVVECICLNGDDVE